jgi:hypothetical protein
MVDKLIFEPMYENKHNQFFLDMDPIRGTSNIMNSTDTSKIIAHVEWDKQLQSVNLCLVISFFFLHNRVHYAALSAYLAGCFIDKLHVFLFDAGSTHFQWFLSDCCIPDILFFS